jgi:hypothetical protein
MQLPEQLATEPPASRNMSNRYFLRRQPHRPLDPPGIQHCFSGIAGFLDPGSWRAVRRAFPSLIPRSGIRPIVYPLRARRRLHNVYVAVSAFLSPIDQQNAQQADCRLDPLFGDTPLYSPPILKRGPRRDCAQRKADSSDGPSPFLAIHFAWDFLHPRDRAKLPEVSIMWTPYARLRRDSQHMSIGQLQHVRPAPVSPPVPISRNRAHITAAALLRFDFHYAHLIRWLGGEYTDEHRDWESSFAIANTVADVPMPAGLPPVDLPRAKRLATEGAPLVADFSCTHESLKARNLYGHHPTLEGHETAVWTKFAKEEALAYHIILPRFLWRFIYGIHLSPLTWVIRRLGEEGRACVDSSTEIEGHKTGPPNKVIPKPKKGKPDTSPPCFYGDALMRHLIWIWNTRISRPGEEILQHVDEISCAFHRLLLHPTMGPVFAAVFKSMLIIPCGCTFGARNSPGIYMTHGEWRAHMSSTVDFGEARSDLAENIELPPPPTPDEAATIAAATPDALHQGIEHIGRAHHHASFVDDTATAHTRANIYDAVNRSVLGAYVAFGFPDEDRRTPAINPKKWEAFVHWVVTYLGLEIDSRLLLVIWPLEKRARLAAMIDSSWVPANSPQNHRALVTPGLAAALLGLVRHGCVVSPYGNFLAIRLQHSLNDKIRDDLADGRKRPKSWWVTKKFMVSLEAMYDIRELRKTLDDNKYHPHWCRPIGLMIPREAWAKVVGDAANEGMGGYCIVLAFMWRLDRSDMEFAGLRLADEKGPAEPCDPDAAHINVLEFLAIVINVWFLIKCIERDEPVGTQKLFIASCIGDNTSALSWMRIAGRTVRPAVRRLARALAGLLTYNPFNLSFPKQHINHIKGELNVAADALSRPSSVAPSWASAISIASPTLDNCKPYQVPLELLTTLSRMISSEQTEVEFERSMTRLLSLELNTLPSGWHPKVTTTSLYRT